MTSNSHRAPFSGRLLMLGCGSVGQCTLPLVLRHVDMPASRVTVMDFEDVRAKIADSIQAGVIFKQARLTQENYRTVLGELVGPGDVVVDLSWNVETLEMLRWCGERDVRFVNTSTRKRRSSMASCTTSGSCWCCSCRRTTSAAAARRRPTTRCSR